MIKVNEDMLIDDLLYTASALSGDVNKNFIRNNYGNFLILNESLMFNFGKVVLLDGIVNTGYYERVLQRKETQAVQKFAEFLDSNQDCLLELCKNYCNIMDEIGFNQYPFWDSLRRYNEEGFKDLILGFYSTFGNDLYNTVKRYFDEERIHIGTLKEDSEYAGFFVGLQWLDSGYIFSIYDYFDSATASSIVHELGHALDAEKFLFPQKKNLTIFSDSLIEVPSTTFEFGFNDYLRNNHIDSNGGNILENCRIDNMKLYFDTLKQVFETPDEMTVYADGFAEDTAGNQYDVRDSIIYGLGYYFAMHLNLIREASNKDFLRIYNNLITSRKEMTFEDSIKTLGFSVDDFVSGKYVKPKLEKNVLELKKRYKY